MKVMAFTFWIPQESSLARSLPGGLCSRREGIIIAAYKAADSRAEEAEYA